MMIMLAAILLPSCVTVVSNVGPPGLDGRAYFGIDYTFDPPTYYWDNNPSIPNSPFFGEYYPTAPGRFNFEYGINEFEYWYGYYEIWIMRGEPGGPYGERGRNGADNYLMLLCDPNGFEAYRSEVYKSQLANTDSLVIEKNDGVHHYKIVLKKGTRK